MMDADCARRGCDLLTTVDRCCVIEVVGDVGAWWRYVPIVEANDELFIRLGVDTAFLTVKVLSDERDVVDACGELNGEGPSVVGNAIVQQPCALEAEAEFTTTLAGACGARSNERSRRKDQHSDAAHEPSSMRATEATVPV